MRTRLTAAVAAAFVFIPAAALAHSSASGGPAFLNGFAHPLGGLDHILAMVTVGLLAWQLGGRALWLVPSGFVIAMGAGSILPAGGIAMPAVEIGIALSVVVLGTMVAFEITPPAALAASLVALLAVFHGHAHGAEMPVGASAAGYAGGFVLATALLHIGGIAIGWATACAGDARLVYRGGGALVALAGLANLAG